MRSGLVVCCLLMVGLLAGAAVWRATPVEGARAYPAWDRQAAARYLDQREVWWQAWPHAQKDHGTVCISCHTNVPYALARPGLRHELHEPSATAAELRMMDSVEKRVGNWAEMVPFYSDAVHGKGKTAESHATEAVLNASLLAGYDAKLKHLRPITRTAFDEAWALQETSGDLAGGWKWQDFHLGPWESAESGYQGAALLMVEAVHAPDGFAREPSTQEHLDRVRDYLRRGYSAQPLLNRLYILWASKLEPGLLSTGERKQLLADVARAQQVDGGWRTSSLDPKPRADKSPEPTTSDGYATGLAVLALEQAGVGRGDRTIERGLAWLGGHQGVDGAWDAASINKARAPETAAGPFMKDAATAYAVMALEAAR